MERKIIKIDGEKCTGCGLCIPNCAEGALQIIDGKARLISDRFCDGLGACIGHCPEGAITIESREAGEYDEVRVLDENIIPAGPKTIQAHLKHLEDHGENELIGQATKHLESKGIKVELNEKRTVKFSGCPGSVQKIIEKNGSLPTGKDKDTGKNSSGTESELSHWPVQLHLIMPEAPFLKNKDLLVAADCTAFACGNFHGGFLKGKALVIACPKLDRNIQFYLEKLKIMVDKVNLNTITVLRMEVPCCGGLTVLVKEVLKNSARKIPVKEIILSIDGKIIKDEWINI